MMYVLVESETGGVYAVKDDKSHERIVKIFSLKDDAERYHMMLDNIDFPRDLEVAEVNVKMLYQTVDNMDTGMLS
ncbi:MAG: hypothetical protein CM15mV6_1880 [uncultured marine virus]|nr:MAG: hypothetical protein CM15mV6_1880 [uncultured marine virus]